MTDYLQEIIDKWQTYKECKQCQQVKLRTEFYVHASNRDGFSNKCKECLRANVRVHQKRVYERRKLEQFREWQARRDAGLVPPDETPPSPTVKTPPPPPEFEIQKPGARSKKGTLVALRNPVYEDYILLIADETLESALNRMDEADPFSAWELLYAHEAASVGTLLTTVRHYLDPDYHRDRGWYEVKDFSSFLSDLQHLCACYDATLAGTPLPKRKAPVLSADDF